MMNNPILNILQGFKSGKSVQSMVRQLAGSDPRIAQAQRMMAGKSEMELRQMCENMCRERGITPEDVARSLGIQIPSER